MYEINWGDLTTERFLGEYWQKKPLLIKNALIDFTDPISADELAGLAMEEGLESRIIATTPTPESTDKIAWHVEHGPFQTFEQFGENNWTLLVQAVNNWSSKTHELLQAVDFLPRWRVDDVMVSFSTPNGGVGAHLDQYDVFIIQGQGKRRWQVGLPDETLETLLPHEELKQVSPFVPMIDEITESGDILYIPPNHPHNGISLENSLNFSLGFQAPNSQELWSAFADKLIDDNLAENRFADPLRKITTQPESLAHKDIQALKNFMLAQLDSDALFKDFIGANLSQCHHPLEILIPVTPFNSEQIVELMSDRDAEFIAVSGIKSLFIDAEDFKSEITEATNKVTTKVENYMLFINGEKFPLGTSSNDKLTQLGLLLAKKAPLTGKTLKSFTGCLKSIQLLTNVINKGFWFIE